MLTQSIGPALYTFFEEDLKCQKGLRPASIRSYRDVLRLFLHFVAQDAQRNLTRLPVAELTAHRVQRFLTALEQDRANHIRTRNHRFAVLKTFFAALATRVPECLAEASRVAAIPPKRVAPPEMDFLTREEIDALFAQLPVRGRTAVRDRALLLLLYNTGARVQEVADLRVANLELTEHPRVHLHGKGDKWRTCPLWAETSTLLTHLLTQPASPLAPEQPVFLSAQRRPLTRFGIYKIVRRHTRGLRQAAPGGKHRHLSPQLFRHTTAVHLLEAGVEVNVIRAWLGHVSLETTNRYAEITLRMKEAALQACEAPAGSPSVEGPRRAVWRDDQALLHWLESL